MYILTLDTIDKDTTKEVLGTFVDSFSARKKMLKSFNEILATDDGLSETISEFSTDYAYILDYKGKSYHFKIVEK